MPEARTAAEPVSKLHGSGVSPQELDYIAFHGDDATTYALFAEIAEAGDAKRFASDGVLAGAVRGGVELVRARARDMASVELVGTGAADLASVERCVRLFVEHVRAGQRFPREFFDSLHDWCDLLASLKRFHEALYWLGQTAQFGIRRLPEAYLRNRVAQAAILAQLGDIETAKAALRDLAERPYLVADRKLDSAILVQLYQLSLASGDLAYYKRVIWRGLRSFHSESNQRRLFADQITVTYRRASRVLATPDASALEKALYALHWLYFRFADRPLIRMLRLDRPAWFALLGVVYAANYLSPGRTAGSFKLAPRAQAIASRGILVTRAMGGIGDLLMMTPGLRALKRQYPAETIQFAIPRAFHPLFEGNSDVALLDIDHDAIAVDGFKLWFNLTDCPASRVEGRSAPNVRRNRIEIFAQAMGIAARRVRAAGLRPRFELGRQEREFAQCFWDAHSLGADKVIGVQLAAAESYRDFPHLDPVIRQLAPSYPVIVFHNEPIAGYDYPNVIKVDGLSLRECAALLERVSLLIAPDSSFVHVGAALAVPTLALFGPIDGRLRTRGYPECEVIDVREQLGCLPCWRNAHTPCKLSGTRESVCMRMIDPQRVIERAQALLS